MVISGERHHASLRSVLALMVARPGASTPVGLSPAGPLAPLDPGGPGRVGALMLSSPAGCRRVPGTGTVARSSLVLRPEAADTLVVGAGPQRLVVRGVRDHLDGRGSARPVRRQPV